MVPVEAMLSRANLLLAQGRAKEAEKQLSDALQQDPENDEALTLLARCKYDQRQFREGIAIVQRAIQIVPDNGYYFYLLAFGYYQTDANHSAQRYLKHAITLQPYAADFYALWALILIDEKDFNQALEKANEGLAIDPENITCLNARSTALNKLKRVEAAIETMQNALQQDPENDFTHVTVGWNLLEKGKHKEAAEHFREALRINPNLEYARTGLKEALKSRIAPYRWLLQYSFWVNNKGKNARWIIPIAVYFGVRLVTSFAEKAGSTFAVIGGLLVALYILFVATSWVINPVANFFLLFNKDGKYALNNSERWSSMLAVVALSSGLLLLLSCLFVPAAIQMRILISGLILLSLALPLGHMEYPLRFRNQPVIQWLSLALALFGMITFAFSISGMGGHLPMAYGITFVVYTWVSALFSK